MSDAAASLWLSVVVPAYRERDSLGILCERLEQVLVPMAEARGERFEVLLVDDGSGDGTWELIRDLAGARLWLRGVKLARNFGHQAAIAAGMTLARGRAVITMDADLQHPPEVLPQLIARWEGGAPVVITRREDAPNLSWFKRLSSRAFYRAFSWLTQVPIAPGSSDFRLLDRRALTYLMQFHDASLFFRGAVAWLDYEDAEVVEFKAAERFAGVTGYTFSKMWHMAAQSMLSFSTRPLKLGIWLGLLTSALSFLELAYALWMTARGDTVPGWASTLGVLSLLFGLLFLMLGILGLYLANIYTILQQRPHFVVQGDTGWSP